MARGDPLKPIEQWHEIRENDFLENLTFRRPFVRKFFTSNIVRRTLAHLFARYGSSSLPLQATTQGYLKVTGMNGLQKHLHYEAQADDIIPEAGQPCSIITQTPPVFGMSRRVANFPNAAASAGTIWVPVIHDNWDGASLDINIHAYSDTACVSGVSDDVDFRIGVHHYPRYVNFDDTGSLSAIHYLMLPTAYTYVCTNVKIPIQVKGGLPIDTDGFWAIKIKRYAGDTFPGDVYVVAVSVECDLS